MRDCKAKSHLRRSTSSIQRHSIPTDAAYEARSSGDDAPIFVGEHPYSPAFYSRGKAEQLNDMAKLAERLRSNDASNYGRGKVFVALRDRQDRELPRELREGRTFKGVLTSTSFTRCSPCDIDGG